MKATTLNVNINIRLSLWSAIKIRISGIKIRSGKGHEIGKLRHTELKMSKEK